MTKLTTILDVPHFCLVLHDADANPLLRIILMTGPVLMAMIATPALSAYYADGDGKEPRFLYLPLGPVQGEEIVTDINRAVLAFIAGNVEDFNRMHDACDASLRREGSEV